MKKIACLSRDIDSISKKVASRNLRIGKQIKWNKKLSVWAQEWTGKNKKTSELENKAREIT